MNLSALPGFLLVDSGELRKAATDEQVVEKTAEEVVQVRSQEERNQNNHEYFFA